jgi:hypothetical protein
VSELGNWRQSGTSIQPISKKWEGLNEEGPVDYRSA